MPWKATEAMQERHFLITDYLSGEYSMTELSERYAVSRKTVYKWVCRYEAAGFDGLLDQSRRPHTTHQIEEALLDMLVAVKKRHPSWGPRKVLGHLALAPSDLTWPAASTVGEWFKRLGLVTPRRRRSHVPPYTQPFQGCDSPNAVWSADFKGQFRLENKRYCYPLTISDNYSRYLLACRGLYRPTYESCRSWFEWTFRTFGLPQAIRTDNGSPFAGQGRGGLSRLSVWWIKLGIVPERIEKGCPQQNGRHERMHRTLKAEATKPASRTLALQQARFERFVKEYNEERPHESLADRTPSSVYHLSERSYPERVLSMEYDGTALVRSIRHNGEMKFGNRLYFVSELLVGERIELKEIEDGKYRLLYGFHPLGVLNLRTRKIDPQP